MIRNYKLERSLLFKNTFKQFCLAVSLNLKKLKIKHKYLFSEKHEGYCLSHRIGL